MASACCPPEYQSNIMLLWDQIHIGWVRQFPQSIKSQKHSKEAAHSMYALCLLGSCSQIGLSVIRISGVIGRRGRLVVVDDRLTPLRTYSRRGIKWMLGFPKF